MDTFEQELKLVPKEDLPFYRLDRHVKKHLARLLVIQKLIEQKLKNKPKVTDRESNRTRTKKKKGKVAVKTEQTKITGD